MKIFTKGAFETILFFAILTLFFVSIPSPMQAQIFTDSFETGDLSATNADGFRWGGTNYTSLVTSAGRIFSGGVVINPPDQADQAITHEFEAKTGNVALRFRYPAGSNMAEQRFNLGGAYRDLWMRYWIRVPINYTHGSGSPSNQKWMALWMQSYESVGPTIVWGFHPAGGGGSTFAVCYGSNGGCGPYLQETSFISVPADRGRWMQLVYQIVASTTESSNDGIIRTWRKWDGTSSYTLVNELTNISLPVCNTCPNGWNAGYLMGWANAPYTEDTQWLLDDFTVSTTSLLDIGTTPTLSLSASPATITNGQSSTLTWSGTNVTSCTASGAWSGARATSGTQSVSPTSTATYTLNCTGTNGSVSRNTTVTVNAGDTAPPTSPTNMAANATSSSSISVTWNPATDNVAVTGYHVERCQGTGCTTFAHVGTPTTSPFVDTGLTPNTVYNYHVRATDAAGNLSGWSNVVGATTQSATPAPTFTLSATPTSITSGGSSTLTWSTITNATSCTASGGTFTGSKSTSGGTQSVSPTSTTTYTLSCTGTGGTTNRSVTVTVQPQAGCIPVSIYPAWDQAAFSAQTGTFIYTFSATPNTATGALFGHSNGVATDYDSLATTVRFRDTGIIDAINGGVYASVSSIPYTLGTRYTFRMTVNVSAKTYSAFVTPEGQAEQTIASNYAFRTAQASASQLNNFSSSDDVGTSGSVTICNPQLSTIAQSCNTVTPTNFSQATYNSYGAPFDAFQTSTNLMNATCTSADTHTVTLTTGVTGDTTRIVYTKGYWYDATSTAWRQYTGTCTGALNGEWCQGSVSATITDPNISTASSTTPTYLVGMTCSVQGGSWKCGCRDTTCANFSWQVQGAGM